MPTSPGFTPASITTSTAYDVVAFGRDLIESLDLDPEYCLLWKAKTSFLEESFYHWLLAYWCFSHCGTASRITASNDYWQSMRQAARNELYQRGTPRRQFRGSRSSLAVEEVRRVSPDPETIIRSWLSRDNAYWRFKSKIQQIHGFGDWVTFKAADMVECLDIAPLIIHPTADVVLDPKPSSGAWRVMKDHSLRHEEQEEDTGMSSDQEVVYTVCHFLQKELANLRAPPRFVRSVNLQEVETILCKWEGYCRGTYWIGKDIQGLKKELSTGVKGRSARDSVSKGLFKAGRDCHLWR